MKNFMFIGKNDGILRITKNEGTAKDKARNGKYVETDLEYMDGGYPVWIFKGKPDGVIVYSETEMKRDAEGRDIEIIPELAKLYAKLK